jgi:hypothetical protein
MIGWSGWSGGSLSARARQPFRSNPQLMQIGTSGGSKAAAQCGHAGVSDEDIGAPLMPNVKLTCRGG